MDRDDDLGPLLIAPSSYLELRNLIREALGFPTERRALLIGIDGVDGSGKSSIAAWLSWQLEMPAIHLDLYLVRNSDPIVWRADDLARVLDAQLALRRPIIVEGILLLRALREIGRVPDFHVFVEKHQHQACLQRHLQSYFASDRPRQRANHVLRWSSAEHDARVTRAHLARLERE